MWESLCNLQRQAQHFLSVLEASRNIAAQIRGCPLDEQHIEDEKALRQMAEFFVKIHGCAHPCSLQCETFHCEKDIKLKSELGTEEKALLHLRCKAKQRMPGDCFVTEGIHTTHVEQILL